MSGDSRGALARVETHVRDRSVRNCVRGRLGARSATPSRVATPSRSSPRSCVPTWQEVPGCGGPIRPGRGRSRGPSLRPRCDRRRRRHDPRHRIPRLLVRPRPVTSARARLPPDRVSPPPPLPEKSVVAYPQPEKNVLAPPSLLVLIPRSSHQRGRHHHLRVQRQRHCLQGLGRGGRGEGPAGGRRDAVPLRLQALRLCQLQWGTSSSEPSQTSLACVRDELAEGGWSSGAISAAARVRRCSPSGKPQPAQQQDPSHSPRAAP